VGKRGERSLAVFMFFVHERGTNRSRNFARTRRRHEWKHAPAIARAMRGPVTDEIGRVRPVRHVIDAPEGETQKGEVERTIRLRESLAPI